MERQFAHRVDCPECHAPARLTVAYRADAAPVVVAFCCRNQTNGAHRPLSAAEIEALRPREVDLPRLDDEGHLI